jgi:hypothetical protein
MECSNIPTVVMGDRDTLLSCHLHHQRLGGSTSLGPIQIREIPSLWWEVRIVGEERWSNDALRRDLFAGGPLT